MCTRLIVFISVIVNYYLKWSVGWFFSEDIFVKFTKTHYERSHAGSKSCCLGSILWSRINSNSPEEANYCFFFSINARTFSIVIHLMMKICYQADHFPVMILIMLICDPRHIRLCSRSPQPAFSSPGRPIRS